MLIYAVYARFFHPLLAKLAQKRFKFKETLIYYHERSEGISSAFIRK